MYEDKFSIQRDQADRRSRPNWLVRLLVFTGVLVLGTLIGYFLARFTQNLNRSREAQAEVVPAADFSLPLLAEEGVFRLAAQRGRGVVINFWASWCFPCKQEMPALEEAWQTYQKQGVVFLGVNVWDQEPDALKFLRDYQVSYLTGMDADESVGDLYQLQGVPTTWFIAPDGSVSEIVLGPLDEAMLDDHIAKILP